MSLTDKEREAVEWVKAGGDHEAQMSPEAWRMAQRLAGFVLRVKRLTAPVGGLETVAWQNPSIKSVSTDAAVSELRTYGEKGVAMADSYSEPLVLRSAAEAKIAGLDHYLTKYGAALEYIRDRGCLAYTSNSCYDNGRTEEAEFNGYKVCAPCRAARALIETSGGEATTDTQKEGEE